MTLSHDEVRAHLAMHLLRCVEAPAKRGIFQSALEMLARFEEETIRKAIRTHCKGETMSWRAMRLLGIEYRDGSYYQLPSPEGGHGG